MSEKMRVVFDTNVSVSGLLWRGPAYEVYQRVRSGRVQLLTSEQLIAELEDVLSRPKFTEQFEVARTTPAELIADYRAVATLVEPAAFQATSRDRDDDLILAIALGGNADVTVTGDKDLRVLGEFSGIAVWTIAKFLLETEAE